jgi:hypothetical protein
MHTQSCPTARSNDLIVEDHNDELLVYDRRSDVAHCLSRVATLLWQNCDGKTDVDALIRLVDAQMSPVDAEDLTLRALTELADKGLLETGHDAKTTVSRRVILQRMAGAGMAALATPLVISAAVPTAAAAKSPPCISPGPPLATCTGTNNMNGDCCGTLFCTRGTGATGTNQYCNTSTSCIGQNQNAAGTNNGSKHCSNTAGAAASCCSGVCLDTTGQQCA